MKWNEVFFLVFIKTFAFNILSSLASTPCRDFPGPGSGHHRTIATFNPMKEFIHGMDEHITSSFDEFVQTHNKKYTHDSESMMRLNVFRNNHRFIESKNRQALTYKLAINHLADRTKDEIKVPFF